MTPSNGPPPKDAKAKGAPLARAQPLQLRDHDAPPPGAKAPLSPRGLALPHERDEKGPDTTSTPDAQMVQAKRDLDAGLVDTDMRATPGLDATRRNSLVPGAGGKPPSKAQ